MQPFKLFKPFKSFKSFHLLLPPPRNAGEERGEGLNGAERLNGLNDLNFRRDDTEGVLTLRRI